MEGGVVKQYKFNIDDCAQWKKEDVKNPKTTRKIRPESKRGVYVQLEDQCEKLRKLAISKKRTKKEAEERKARRAGQMTLYDYNSNINANALYNKIVSMNLKDFVIRSTVLISNNTVPFSQSLSKFPILVPKIQNHKSNFFRWSLKVTDNKTYTIRFNRITAYRAKTLKEVVDKYVQMYSDLSTYIRAFNMYSTTHHSLSINIIDKILKKNSDIIVNV